MEEPSETCRVLFQNKINLRYCASGWFYYRNILVLGCTVLQMSNQKTRFSSFVAVFMCYFIIFFATRNRDCLSVKLFMQSNIHNLIFNFELGGFAFCSLIDYFLPQSSFPLQIGADVSIDNQITKLMRATPYVDCREQLEIGVCTV
jgi:hypothetical protein